MNFNTSNEANDNYIYMTGEGTYEGTVYRLWKLGFEDGYWKVQNKVATSITSYDIGGVVRLGSYVYVGNNAGPYIYRYLATDLSGEIQCTFASVPGGYAFPNDNNAIATDGTYLYILGYSGRERVIGKFAVSGTTITYQSSFSLGSAYHDVRLSWATMGCDGTYLYLTFAPAAASTNKRIRRYTLTGSSTTDFDYIGTPHPWFSDTTYEKRDLILGVFRYANKWWIVEYKWEMMTRDSVGYYIEGSFVVGHPAPYLTEVTF